MGISLQALRLLQEMKLLLPGSSVLDIGSSNLYSATPAALREFIECCGRQVDTDTTALIQRLASGSAYGLAGAVSNSSFVGELLEHTGLTYLSLDIAEGYRTKIFDLNVHTVDASLRGQFDLVINYGTTEHLFNQLNAFCVIHDAVKPGGHIVHQLPTVGRVDHGYFTYTPRFFLDLAGHNEYDIVRLEFRGPVPGKDLFSVLRDYEGYFPRLADTQQQAKSREFEAYRPIDIGTFVVFRKRDGAEFRVPMETSTSVGHIVPGGSAFDTAQVATAIGSTRTLYRLGFSLIAAATARLPKAIGNRARKYIMRGG